MSYDCFEELPVNGVNELSPLEGDRLLEAHDETRRTNNIVFSIDRVLFVAFAKCSDAEQRPNGRRARETINR